MGILNIFRKSKKELSDEQEKWNKMWDMWVENKADSPYAELMTYQSEINNGGHDQYFFNIRETGDLQKEIKVLESILSVKLQSNLQNAYKAYLVLDEKTDDENAEKVLEQCDDIFYENEEEITCALKEYADKVKL